MTHLLYVSESMVGGYLACNKSTNTSLCYELHPDLVGLATTCNLIVIHF